MLRLSQKIRLWERDKYKCRYCGWDFAVSFETWWHSAICVDHVIPKKRGGTNDDDNLVTACFNCNAAKGEKPFASFEEAYEFLRKYREVSAPTWYNEHVHARRSQWGA